MLVNNGYYIMFVYIVNRERVKRRAGFRSSRVFARRQQAGAARALVQGRPARAHLQHALAAATPSAASLLRHQVSQTMQ